MVSQHPYPGGRRFAFTILDDTDVSTVRNVRPIYRLLEELGMRTTKTVWPLSCPEGSKNFGSSQTLDDPEYLCFVQDLQERGFEIAWHGATMESSYRERTARGLERFRKVFGAPPRVAANHAHNRENLYWGKERIDDPLLRWFYGFFVPVEDDHYQGHVEGSGYWWGDLCQRNLTYMRNLTFNELNLANVNPSMPYQDPSRPQVDWWFSAADAEGRREFNELLAPQAQDRLESQGGFCVVATHFGKGFVEEGRVHPDTQRCLRSLSERNGWFPTVSELLDFLRSRGRNATLPALEWKKMQWKWARDFALRKFKIRRVK